MTFRREAILLEDGMLFGEVMEPWQQEDFAAVDHDQHPQAHIERRRAIAKPLTWELRPSRN